MNNKLLVSYSYLLAASVKRVFPHSIPLAPYIAHDYFGYDFLVEEGFSLEEHEKEEIGHTLDLMKKGELSFQIKTMMRENCAAFFTYKGEEIKAYQVANQDKNLINLISFQDYLDLYPYEEEPLFAIEETCLVFFRVKKVFYPPFGQVALLRIEGALPEHKKAFQKAVKVSRKNNFLAKVESEGFLQRVGEELIWLERGLCFRNCIIEKQRELSKTFGFKEVELPLLREKRKKEFRDPLLYSEDREYVLDCSFPPSGTIETKKWPFIHKEKELEDFFVSRSETKTHFYLSFTYEDRVKKTISSLQFFLSLSSLIGIPLFCRYGGESSFLSEIESYLPSEREKSERKGSFLHLELLAYDAYKRAHKIANFEVKKKGSIEATPFVSLEKVLALLVEHNGGEVPYCFELYQLYFIPAGKEAIKTAQEYAKEAERRGLRCCIDKSEGPLSMRVKEAYNQKKPLVVVIGDKEVKQGFVTIKNTEGKHRTLPFNELLQEIDLNERG